MKLRPLLRAAYTSTDGIGIAAVGAEIALVVDEWVRSRSPLKTADKEIAKTTAVQRERVHSFVALPGKANDFNEEWIDATIAKLQTEILAAEEMLAAKGHTHVGLRLFTEAYRKGDERGWVFMEVVVQLDPSVKPKEPPTLVVIESPFSGDVKRNQEYLQRCIRDCLSRGESPYASHQMLTAALDDTNPRERELGIDAGFAWRKAAAKTVVYEDYGLSRGMIAGIDHAESINHPIERRTIGPNPKD